MNEIPAPNTKETMETVMITAGKRTKKEPIKKAICSKVVLLSFMLVNLPDIGYRNYIGNRRIFQYVPETTG
jgi:hypothetical protein